MKLKSLLFILFLFTNYALPYDWLYVQDPHNWWGGQGTIEEATISIKPKGIYMEYGLYLTFSARNLNFSNSDTLEVQFYFDLPENAIVCDSWLWIDDEIIKAKILDQWTASQIYEDIVNRRRDPSILFKRGPTNYELRIYPLVGDGQRKIKITYLCPTQWNTLTVQSPLPTNLLRTSYNQVSKLNVLTWLEENWKHPQIVEFLDIEFSSKSDSLFGNFLLADLPSEAIQSSINFSVDAPFKNGIYVGKFESEDEGTYQMALLPSKALNISTSYKVAVLIDYEASKSTYSKNDVVGNLRSLLHNNLSARDSFNIIYSGINISRVSEKWLPADSTTIESTFLNLQSGQIADYSSLPALIGNGINFVKDNGNDGSIILISNSDEAGDYNVANDLIDDLMDLMTTKLPIHVVDFENQNYSYYWFGGRTYYGNEYFYTNLARLTAANYYRLLYNEGTLSGIMSSAFQSLSGFISSFDLHTKLENGFCYGRYSLDANVNSVYLNKPILQVGKYLGSLPFIIEVSGVYNSTPFSQTFTLPENEIFDSDSLNEKAWTGNYIQYLESQTQTNDVVDEIVNYSVGKRVLSIYSAFICLEPSRGGEVCYDCYDESDVINVEDSVVTQNDSLSLSAYPNPFNGQVNIKINLPASLLAKNVTFRIYNVLGQVVKTYSTEGIQASRKYQFIWNGTNDYGSTVASGVYIFVVNTPEKNYSVKLLLMK